MERLFGVVGVIACMLLVGMDFYTSYIGAETMFPHQLRGMLALMPFVMASLALSMNALMALMLRRFRERNFTEFSKMFLVVVWMVFLIFDGITSWTGFAVQYSETETFEGVAAVYVELTGLQQFCSVLFPVLLVASPFLLTVFWDLCSDLRNEVQQFMEGEE